MEKNQFMISENDLIYIYRLGEQLQGATCIIHIFC